MSASTETAEPIEPTTPTTPTEPAAATAPSARTRAPNRLWAAVLGWPWWVQVLALFVLSRIVTTAMMLSYASRQDENPWTGASPGYFDFAAIWDGHWYRIIADSGYPTELPVNDEGHVTQNAWAFMPVYPMVVRALMFVTGAGWPVASVIVTVLCSAAASLVFYRLMRRVLDHGTAMFAVVIFLVAPLSPILQVSYSESMQILLLCIALLLVLERRYLAAIPVIVVMSFVRPSGLAFALFLFLHFIMRIVRHRVDPFPPAEWARLIATGLTSALAGFSWMLIAGIATGSMTAYTDTELSWRAGYVGRGELVPFSAWFEGAEWWISFLTQDPNALGWGIALVLLLVGLFGVLMFRPAVVRLGADMRLWVVSYVVYLLAVFFPQSSTFRLLMPLFPLAGAMAQPKNPYYRALLVIACFVGQWVWLAYCWRVEYRDWSPP